MGDALQNTAAVLAQTALATPATPGGTGGVALPPPPGPGSWYLDEPAMRWVQFNPKNFEARTIFSENTTAFSRFSQQRGMVLLDGPGDGSGWNQGGFDFVAFNVEGPLSIAIPDEKATKAKTVGSASALTTNWQQNIEGLQRMLASPDYDLVPRIKEVRARVDEAVANAQKGAPPPGEFARFITRYGEDVPMTRGLQEKLASGPRSAPAEEESTSWIEPIERALVAPRSTSSAEVAEATMQAAPVLLGWLQGALDEYGLSKAVDAELAKAESAAAAWRAQNPDKGVLLVVPIHQAWGSNNLFVPRPGPQATDGYPLYGFATEADARAAYESTPKYQDANYEALPPAMKWLPPLGAGAGKEQ